MNSEVDAKLKKFKELAYDRVGLVLKADILALKVTTGDSAKLIKLIEKAKGLGLTTLALMSDKKDVLIDAVKAAASLRPLICFATPDTVEDARQTGSRTITAPWPSEGKILMKSLT